MKLCKGYQLKHFEGEIFTVCFSGSIRNKYFYVVKDSKGNKSSIGRNAMLKALKENVFKIIN